ncbi:methyltransferase [Nocardia thailandica]
MVSRIPPLPVLRAVERVRYGLAVAYRTLVPGHIALLEMQLGGFLAQAIATAADLGIADELGAGPRSAADLAVATGADEAALRRLMRLLVAFGVFAQRRDGTYALTRVGSALRADSPVSLRDLSRFFGSAFHRNHWSHLTDAVRTGRSVGPVLDGKEFFAYAAEHRDIGDLFDNAMTSATNLSVEPLLASYDFGRHASIVDVGGGRGSFLLQVLRRHPGSTGVLFDLPDVVAAAPDEIAAAGLESRCTTEAGSFFDTVPGGADAYLLKHIVHDWSDAEAEQILRTVRAGMPAGATLLLIELVLPDHRRPHAGQFIDLEMLVNATGHERTEAQFRDLLARGGFTLTELVPTAAPDCILAATATPGR